ncbi:MAG TPA: glutamyl-tRNA reductase [Gemmatimonadales bacterium]|jgi:glutamyl-tRNA reductase|nr:glutamyl-tRNA reductase [Gemmatimonadales bacterium]
MTIRCLSITHHTAPVALRERLSLSGQALEEALTRAGRARAAGRIGVSELVILSTCNRLEVYTAPPEGSAGDSAPGPLLTDFLADALSVDPAAFGSRFLCYTGAAAAGHLCRVAAGLDSMVLGESEILGQVAGAHEVAVRLGSTGPALTALFRTAIRSGRRVRSETAIGRDSGSISSLAVKLAARAAGGVGGKCVAVLGAGLMARKAVTALSSQGAGEIVVVSRTTASAAALASAWGGEARTFEELTSVLARAHIVIGSTSAPHPVVAASEVRRVAAERTAPLVFIDIAVPRDVEPAVREIPGVQLFDLDDLQIRLDRSLARRRKEVPRAEAIVVEEVERFEASQAGSGVPEVVAELRRQAEQVRARELARVLRRLPAADAELRRRLERFSRTLVNQLLHRPTARLRVEAGNGHATEYARIARELFGLGGTGSGEAQEEERETPGGG